MLQSIFESINHIIQTNPWLAVFAVFLGGVLTASNPCVLVMIPLMIGVVGGYRGAKGVRKTFLFSLVFVAGLSITFVILGVIAALTGRLFGNVGKFWPYFVAFVCVVMGIYMLDIFKFNIPIPQNIKIKKGGILGSFVLGLLFGVVSSPCATPILAVLLVLIASKGSIFYGTILLLSYALGHSALILVAGTSMGIAKNLIESKKLSIVSKYLRKFAGVIIVLVGIYFLLFAFGII